MPTDKEAGWRKAVIATLISVVLSPIGIGFGWYLSHLLARPKLQLEYIEWDYLVEPLKPSADVVDTVRKNRDVAAGLREILARNDTLPECRRWLDGAAWNSECLSVVSDSVMGVHDALSVASNALTANLSTLEKWNPPAMPGDLDMGSGLDSIYILILAKPLLTAEDKHLVLSNTRSKLRANKRILQGLEALKTELQRLEGAQSPRNGEVEFEAGILNAGESDGVIQPNAALVFGDARVGLVARDEAGSPFYAVVKAHSLARIKFALAPSESEKSSIEKLRVLLKAHQAQEFEVHVATSDGKSLSTSGRFE
jgi:hypothetical protein